MKFIKLKTLIITSIVCLLPILLGISVWDKLPETMAIHFDIYGNPDNFASRGFVVFGLPVLMMLLQWICCVINDVNTKKFGERVKFTRVTKWIIPVMSIILQAVTIGYGMGIDIDIRKVVCILVGVIFLVIGNYLPKFDRVKNFDLESDKARKVNRFIGFETVIMGILFLISALLPPIFSVICLIMLIPYAIISIIYGIKVSKE